MAGGAKVEAAASVAPDDEEDWMKTKISVLTHILIPLAESGNCVAWDQPRLLSALELGRVPRTNFSYFSPPTYLRLERNIREMSSLKPKRCITGGTQEPA